MADYHRLEHRVVSVDLRRKNPWDDIIADLVTIWLQEYDEASPGGDILEVPAGGFWYLFDCDLSRLIAAFGFSRGKHVGPRDKSRMAGHPLGAGALFHRGHAIPHTLGGPTDINLVPQLGSVNVGAFRVLEKEAVANPGSLYFTHWQYAHGCSQLPVSVEQGLLLPGQLPKIARHTNAAGAARTKHRPANVLAFVHMVLPDARRVTKRWRVPTSVVIAQAAQETGWGKSVKGNAYFGIKASARLTTSVVAFKTTEIVAGGKTNIHASFRAYGSFSEAADDYGRFLNENPRYAAAFEFVRQPLKFAAAIAKAGYATDPAYGAKLKAIIRSECLTEFDG